jgi:hypothetical protein
MTKDTEKATVEKVPLCLCTNTELEAGKTCGLPFCPNALAVAGDRGAAPHPRLRDGEPAAVPTVENRVDGRALVLLDAHPIFDRDHFAWVGSEHLGGGIFCASVYTGTAADSPYLWITLAEEREDGYLICVWVGDAAGEDEPEDPFLVAECGDEDLADEALRLLASAGKAAQR